MQPFIFFVLPVCTGYKKEENEYVRESIFSYFGYWLLTVSWAAWFLHDDDDDEMTMHFRFFTRLYKILCCHHHQTPPFKTKSVAFIKTESVFRVCVRACVYLFSEYLFNLFSLMFMLEYMSALHFLSYVHAILRFHNF